MRTRLRGLVSLEYLSIAANGQQSPFGKRSERVPCGAYLSKSGQLHLYLLFAVSVSRRFSNI